MRNLKQNDTDQEVVQNKVKVCNSPWHPQWPGCSSQGWQQCTCWWRWGSWWRDMWGGRRLPRWCCHSSPGSQSPGQLKHGHCQYLRVGLLSGWISLIASITEWLWWQWAGSHLLYPRRSAHFLPLALATATHPSKSHCEQTSFLPPLTLAAAAGCCEPHAN